MTGMVKYEAARAALQAAHKVDEVKDIRDKAQAMAAYAKQANDTALVEWATEIKVRAERRAGEMLAQMKVNGSRHDGRNIKKPQESHDTTPEATLDSIGISKDQSSRWQKLAAIPEKQFEEAVAAAKEVAGEVTTAAMLRARRTDKPASKPPAREVEKDDPRDAQIKRLTAALEEANEAKSDLADIAREQEDKLTALETTDPDEQQKEIQKLQKRIVRLEAEIERLTIARNDCQNKNNELIRQVKILQRKPGGR